MLYLITSLQFNRPPPPSRYQNVEIIRKTFLCALCNQEFSDQWFFSFLNQHFCEVIKAICWLWVMILIVYNVFQLLSKITTLLMLPNWQRLSHHSSQYFHHECRYVWLSLLLHNRSLVVSFLPTSWPPMEEVPVFLLLGVADLNQHQHWGANKRIFDIGLFLRWTIDYSGLCLLVLAHWFPESPRAGF